MLNMQKVINKWNLKELKVEKDILKEVLQANKLDKRSELMLEMVQKRIEELETIN